MKLLVKCQRMNGVALISGKDDNHAVSEYLGSIVTAREEKVAVIMASSHFFSLLSDGSEARKTDFDKELVLIRIERGGIPVYITFSLFEMSDFGGTDAASLKEEIDQIFDKEKGFLRLDSKKYEQSLVIATADGASVNFGPYTGLLTKIAATRPWLLKRHCSNRRTELAIKTVFEESIFKEVEDLYVGIFYFHKNSGKVLNEVKEACKALGIQYYKLKKIHGTRFVQHRRRALKRLLDIWPGIVTAYENIESDRKTKGETRAKVKGYLKKLRSYKFFQKVINFLDILDCIAPVSLVFEGKGGIFEVAHVIAKLEVNLNYFECSESLIRKFPSNDSNDITVRYLRMGHALKKPENREYINIPFDFMTYSKSDQDIVKDGAIELNSNLIRTIKERFEDFLGDTIFTSMKWFDPQYWEDSSDCGLEDTNFIISHFKIPLEANGLN